MRYKIISALLIAISAMATLPVFSVQAQSDTENLQQRLIVTFDESINDKSRAAVRGVGAAMLKELPLVNGIVVTVKDGAMAKSLAKLEGIRAVEKDALVSAYRCSPWPSCKDVTVTSPTQPAQQLPWGIDMIDAEKAWTLGSGIGVKVAVIDTGIDKDHPDLIDNIDGGVNFVSLNVRRVADASAWDDNNGHGTHVAGTIAAVNNTVGVVGVAPKARLYGVKVLNSSGSGYVSNIISGIEWSIRNGMNVINMSLGSSSDVQAFHDAVDAAYSAGIVVIAAAGNSGDSDSTTDEVSYPAKYSSVIAVAATDVNNQVVYFSSDGSEVEVAAPGLDILSTTMGGGYGIMSGTSMASPHIAGAVAAALSAHVGWNASDIRTYIQTTSDDLGNPGRDVFYGYGLVDVEELVTGLQTQ